MIQLFITSRNHILIVTRDKELNILIYGTFPHQHMQELQTLKNGQILTHPVL